MNATNLSDNNRRQSLERPGFLLAPLGWLANWLTETIESEAALHTTIYSLSPQRMHLIALAVAHLDADPARQVSKLLFNGSFGTILDQALGRRPRGLKRALNKLQAKVLSPEGYRRLIRLLDEPASFKFLAHSHQIDEHKLEILDDIPIALRTLFIPLLSSIGRRGLVGMTDGLRFLVERGAAPSFDALLTKLQTFRQRAQLVAHIRGLVEALPIPAQLPPPKIRSARRLDSPSQIRDLAKRWQNCLEQLMPGFNNGRYILYLWDEPETPVACLIVRRGTLGWFLAEVTGPQNEDPAPEQLSCIRRAFAEVDVPDVYLADSIFQIISINGDEEGLDESSL